MSMFKRSFSLIFTIFLVGILATTAFARGAFWEKVSADGSGGFNFKFINTESTAKDFTVKVYTKDSTTGEYTVFQVETAAVNAPSVPSPTDATPTNTINIAKSAVPGDIQVGTVYKLELFDGGTQPLGVKYGVLTDAHNLSMASIANDPNGLLDVDGTGLVNANHTGMSGGVTKRSGQNQHGFYQNNTNSCAGCHQTHTAANGESLLFKDGVYSTCSACHDGTTGAYNSFAPVDSAMTASIDGTFNVQTTGHNGSLHEADGSLQISAAPGGNNAGGAFAQEFDCASCHAAHGAGSLESNNLNTDPMGWGSVPYASAAGQSITYVKGHGTATITTTLDNKNGKLFTFAAADIINGTANIPTAEKTPYILVKTTATADNVVYNATNNTTKAAFNSFWSRAKVPAGSQVIQMYRWNGANGTGSYVADYSLWNRELGYPYVANTVLKAGTLDLTSPVRDTLKVVWKDGFAFGTDVASIDSATVSVGIDVETTGQIQSLYDSSYKGVPVMLDATTQATDALGNPLYEANTAYVPDSGTEMSKYCASCHTDYASATRTDNTGTYSLAHRHATLQDRLTCVRCHYAHGSEAQIMHDANDNTYYNLIAGVKAYDGSTKTFTSDQAISYLLDPNPSSALKRYTGMSVCYACHGKGEQFIGGNSGTAADTTTGQFLMGGDPGSARTVISQ